MLERSVDQCMSTWNVVCWSAHFSSYHCPPLPLQFSGSSIECSKAVGYIYMSTPTFGNTDINPICRIYGKKYANSVQCHAFYIKGLWIEICTNFCCKLLNLGRRILTTLLFKVWWYHMGTWRRSSRWFWSRWMCRLTNVEFAGTAVVV